MYNVRTFVRKVNLCIMIKDDFKDRTYNGPVHILIDNQYIKPTKRDRGLYIYTDIPNEKVNIKVNSAEFEPYEMNLDLSTLNALNPIHTIRLKPNQKYALPNNITGVKFKVLDKEGNAVQDAEIKAFIGTPNYYMAKINSDRITPRSRIIKLLDVQDENIENNTFMIISDKEDEIDEFITIGKQLDTNKYKIGSKLKSTHSKKDRLLKAFTSKTSENGSCQLLTKQLHKPKVKLTIQINNGKQVKEVSTRLTENSVIDIGEIKL